MTGADGSLARPFLHPQPAFPLPPPSRSSFSRPLNSPLQVGISSYAKLLWRTPAPLHQTTLVRGRSEPPKPMPLEPRTILRGMPLRRAEGSGTHTAAIMAVPPRRGAGPRSGQRREPPGTRPDGRASTPGGAGGSRNRDGSDAHERQHARVPPALQPRAPG